MFDAAWPAWLGLEAWLLPWIVPYALAHAQLVGERLGELATGLVTFTDRTSLVRRGFIEGTAPPWRRGGALDARSALAQIERIDQSLATSETLGPRLVASSRTIDLDLSRSEFAQQYALGARCHEIYVRSLVQGHGPTSAPAGLLERHDNSWAKGASAQLLDLFR
jgi:hypothetical protein